MFCRPTGKSVPDVPVTGPVTLQIYPAERLSGSECASGGACPVPDVPVTGLATLQIYPAAGLAMKHINYLRVL